MPPQTPSERLLEAEVALLEAEVDLAVELLARGYAVPGHRAPTDAEVGAGVRFAELERLVVDSAARLELAQARARAAALEGLADNLGDLWDADPNAVTRRLSALLDPLGGAALGDEVTAAVSAATADAYRELAALHQAAGEEVLAEARRQGAALNRAAAPLTTDVAEQLRAQAERVAAQPVAHVLTVARDAAVKVPLTGTAADAIEAAIDAAETASTKAGADAARQAATVGHDAGRTATLRETAATLPPAQVYASELLDSQTCSPCSFVDGRDYATLEEGLADYPGNGGYWSCLGGQRCRGTLVVVWDTEATPTVDDRRGEDPDAPPRQPVEPPPPPPAPAAPAITSDTDLTALSREDLEAGIADAFSDGDYGRAEAISDELDRRHPAAEPLLDTGPVVDADGWVQRSRQLDAALDELGLPARAMSARPKRVARGRRVDEVRAEYDDYVHNAWLDAEEATRGNLTRRATRDEYRARYGSEANLFTGPARVAAHYASEELRRWWQANGRLTFAEFAEQSGIRDAKTRARAAAARIARDEHIFRESGGGSRRRPPKPRRPLTAGEQLDRDRRRAERARKVAGG